MKNKMNLLKLIAILLLAGVVSCGKDDEPALKGTKWKLMGIVDAQTGLVTELEPKDCEECYTLTFSTNYIASGLSISQTVHIDLSHLDPLKYIEDIYIDEGYPDGHDFRLALLITESYAVTTKELKLFYRDRKNYLLFKLIEL